MKPTSQTKCCPPSPHPNKTQAAAAATDLGGEIGDDDIAEHALDVGLIGGVVGLGSGWEGEAVDGRAEAGGGGDEGQVAGVLAGECFEWECVGGWVGG